MKIRLDYGEARDIDGIVHIPREVGLWMNSACNGVRLGTNENGLRGYCPVCFPERQGKVKTKAGLFKIKTEYQPEYRVEVVDEPSISQPKIPRKPKLTKSLDEILRKPQATFNRRKLS